ncbi:MAG: FKBP-type peptidyl-prolyl cis-trans isomerase [Methanocellales archaeon]|nr:FKBP-type peptidyl-prolyl cis-trans isomerase [Methanocellales archaeon]MDD3421050.1 FKBP-type peptidyl-prolyl cis-trans isomerase [Methanocellales archaeon]MDD4898044.1 FKBP-type peptidyl-prolyl cis-trans isomerase [Methanocellales archaeon]
MPIKNGNFIKITYTGRLENGDVFDTTDEKIAKEFGIFNENAKYGANMIVVGSGHVIKGLDEDVVGKEVGYKGSVQISPEKGFGERDPALVETAMVSKFEERPYPGMQVSINGKLGTVETVIGRRARVDFNHPLAGKNVTYEYTLDEKLEGTKAKMEGLIHLYVDADLDVEIEGGIATVIVPYALSFDQRWLVSKQRIANEILSNTRLQEVRYLEKHVAPKVEKKAKKSEKNIEGGKDSKTEGQ